MSTEQLIQEGQELEEKLVALSVQENVGKREDIKAEEFTEFQKKFSGLPEL
jgi:ribosomal protein L29